MTLWPAAGLRRYWPGPAAPHPVAASHVRVDTPGPGHGHSQLGQNGALSSKKTTTGITAQPTMS